MTDIKDKVVKSRERGGNVKRIIRANEDGHIHVARPEDGTEIIDEDRDDAWDANDTDDAIIAQDSEVVDTNTTIADLMMIMNTTITDKKERKHGNHKQSKKVAGSGAPFKDLVVYIWKSWKIIIG
jgi:hypothetical protein